ncbi:MAG TPA: alpha/beta fold hydrolase [Chromatiales bacterium]|nr:alpha/beta fold hydrolase [Chromatiales bacterium]
MKRTLLLVLLLLLLPLRAQAEVALLVHGYLSNSATWEWSGVNAALRGAGWRQAGNFAFSPAGLVEQPLSPATRAEKRFYTVDLPSLAPAPLQAAWLEAAVERIRQKHPGEKITLVGHSAGGVVARLVLVRYGKGNVTRLITIAAPHLGTDRAVKALDAVDNEGPFGWFKEWIVRNEIGSGLYRTLEASRGILFDLVPPVPGTLLHWLNLQPHPEIEYVSVVRSGGYFIAGDLLVPPFSQDMNRVPALAGKSKVYVTVQGHPLTPADGLLLARIL